MGIPLDKIITFDQNVYEMTSVAILEAKRLASESILDEHQAPPKEKLVSQALTSTMENKVEYLREE